MRERFTNGIAPYIPPEPIFNEQAQRSSEHVEVKPKNLLAAIMGNPMADMKMQPEPEKKLEFDEAHYDKFQREDKRAQNENNTDNTATRRRQNPLGDFKFKRINELF